MRNFSHRVRCLISWAVVAASLSACRSDVVVHPPPPEERWVSSFSAPLDSWFEMSQPDIKRYLVSGISKVNFQTEYKYWIERRGVFRVLAPPYHPLKFHLEFELTAELLRKAGTVRLNVEFNGVQFGTFTYNESGRHHLERVVKNHSLSWERDSEITVEVIVENGQPWKDFELGLFVTSLGFRL